MVVINSYPYKKARIQTITWLLLIMILLGLFAGCANKYKITEKQNTPSTFLSLMEPGQYLILHSNNEEFHLLSKDLKITEKIISGTIKPLPENRKIYKVANTNEKPLEEVHIYISGLALKENNNVVIPFSQILKIERYEPKPKVGLLIGKSAGSIVMIFKYFDSFKYRSF